jgi:hypothetical protein
MVILRPQDTSGHRRAAGVVRKLATAGMAAAMAASGVASVRAVDEIQVYNAEIAEVGQFTVQQHLNYTFIGRKEGDYPGALVPNHTLNGTPEFAYGVTDWFEAGLYIPWAVEGGGGFVSNNFKLRALFVTPDAEKKDFFYGLNFEFDFPSPKFDQNQFAMELRPIIGWRNPQWEFIINPIFDAGFGPYTYLDFAPAARLARKLAEDTFLGVEYYSDLGQPGNLPPISQQQHNIFGVVDFKIWDVDVDFGVGYGLTAGSDRLIAKTILSYAFPVPGKSQSEDHKMQAPPTMRGMTRFGALLQTPADPFAGMR